MLVDQNSSLQKPTQRNAEATAIELQDNVLKINDHKLSGAGERQYIKETCIKTSKIWLQDYQMILTFFDKYQASHALMLMAQI